MAELKQEIVIDGKTYIIQGDVDLKVTLKDPTPIPDPDPTTKPTEGTIKEGGWGGGTDAKFWKATVMRNPSDQFKVVDNKDINVATNFKALQSAQNFINYFKSHPFPPVVIIEPPVPIDPNAKVDAQGVVMIYTPKAGGQVVTANETNQKESEHDGQSRTSLYSNKSYSANSGELTECFVMDLADSDEQNAPKLYSGGHTGSGDSDETRQGCCYAVGVNENGSLHLAKEWPHHPVTPKAYDKINYIDQSWKNLGGSIKNKFTPMKIIYYPKDGGTYIEWWFDKKGLETGKLENNWKQMAWAHDKGDWGSKFGPALVENQGVKYKGKVMGFYIRIDTPKKPVKFSYQGQHELEIPARKLV